MRIGFNCVVAAVVGVIYRPVLHVYVSVTVCKWMVGIILEFMSCSVECRLCICIAILFEEMVFLEYGLVLMVL